MRQKALFACAAIIVATSVLVMAYLALVPYIDHPTRDLSKDIDWSYLNRGLDQIHRFRDTGRWWTGTWCGVVPFWRPLTSYVFWGERLLWPKEFLLPRQIILVVLHLVFVAMAGYLTWRLTGRRWLALLSMWLFAGFRPFPITSFFGYNFAVYDLLLDPKNVTDPLSGIAMIASLIFLVNGSWLASLALAMVSVGFKETGFMTWPIAALTVLWIRWSMPECAPPSTINHQPFPIRLRWLPVSAWTAGFLGLAVVHYLAVGLGYRMGTNAAWSGRAELYFGGPIGRLFVLDDPGAAIVSLLVFLAIIGSRKLSLLPRFIGIMAALTVGVLVDTRLQHTSWDASMVRLLTYRLDLKVILLCLFWLLVAWEGRYDWRTVGFGLGMSLVSSVPTWFAAQTQEHTRYVSAFFMEMAVAAVIWQNALAIAQARQERKIPNASSASERMAEPY